MTTPQNPAPTAAPPLPVLGEDGGMGVSQSQPSGGAPSELRKGEAEPSASLTPRLFDALLEVGRYDGTGRLYWWRRTSMQQLEALGYVEQWLPNSVAQSPRMKARPYRLSATGRAALQPDATPEMPSAEGDGTNVNSGMNTLTQEQPK